MRRNWYTLLLVGFLSLVSSQLFAQNEKDIKKGTNKKSTNTQIGVRENLTEKIVGTWQVDEIYKGKKNISNTDTLAFNETLIFDNEGKYVSHSGSEEKIDSGMYRLNENHSILYLESETEKKTTEWSITFSKGEMSLQPRGTYPHAASFKYNYTRATGN